MTGEARLKHLSQEAPFFTTKFHELIAWSRKNSLWPYPFATACCGIEFMSVVKAPGHRKDGRQLMAAIAIV